MSKSKKENVLYQAKLFNNINFFYKNLVENDNLIYCKYLIDAVNEGVIDPDLTIVDNMDKFINKGRKNQEVASSKDFVEGRKKFYMLLNELDKENMTKFYNMKLIDYVLEKKLVPYQQVDITRMYFMNPYKSDRKKLDFLNLLINNIYEGSQDLRIINSFDKLKLNPEFLRNEPMYQMLIESLINEHLKEFDKYKECSKDKRDFDNYIRRMIYRHQNKGFYIPSDECRNIIINTYAYNGWIKELCHMIKNNTLKITESNRKEVIEQISQGFQDMAIVEKFSKGKYIDLYNKLDEIIELINSVATSDMKLTRKDRE